jgi:flavin-dependent thymidylate synthase
MGSDVQRWADAAMFRAEDMPEGAQQKPQVHLIWMTPDPLGAAAAMNNIYEGRVSRSLGDVTRAEREQVLADMQKTVLKVPMENIQFHFLIEGVTRAFTHQLVRQRHASFAQESMRFAVFGQNGANLPVGLPPSLAGTEPLGTGSNQALGAEDDTETYARNLWDQAVEMVEQTYIHLIDAGMPAEDARGLLPTNMLTRVHYVVNLRSLHQYAGLRLSTQAQFEWREVFAGIINAIRNYDPYTAVRESFRRNGLQNNKWVMDALRMSDAWQYEGIANLFRPVCYYTGKCEFMGTADRYCNIRERVEQNHAAGRPSSEWHEDYTENLTGYGQQVVIPAINPREWLENPAAARTPFKTES